MVAAGPRDARDARDVPDVTSRRAVRVASGGVHLVALAAGGWLAATRPLFRTVWDHAGERGALFFSVLAVPAALLAGLLALAWWVWARWRGLPHARRPLLALGASVLLFVAFPFRPLVDGVDFRVHERSRAEIVRLVETGPLAAPCPRCEIVHVPRPYPTSVSNGGGQRALSVWGEDGVTTVVFWPTGEGVGNLLHGGSAFLYRSDGQPPSLPHPKLVYASGAQKLRDHWYRVTFPAPLLLRR